MLINNMQAFHMNDVWTTHSTITTQQPQQHNEQLHSHL